MFGEDLEQGGGEEVDAEETEVLALAEAGGGEDAFGFGGGGFFDDGFDFVESVRALDAGSADAAVVREFAFVGGLDGGDGAIGGECGFEELCGAGFLGATGVEVIADHEEKRIVTGEIGSAMDGVAVAEGFRLWDEAHLAGERSGCGGVGGFVTGADDHGDFSDASGGDFLGENGEGGFRNAILVHECLKREGALVFSGGGNDGFGDFHGRRVPDFNRCCNA